MFFHLSLSFPLHLHIVLLIFFFPLSLSLSLLLSQNFLLPMKNLEFLEKIMSLEKICLSVYISSLLFVSLFLQVHPRFHRISCGDHAHPHNLRRRRLHLPRGGTDPARHAGCLSLRPASLRVGRTTGLPHHTHLARHPVFCGHAGSHKDKFRDHISKDGRRVAGCAADRRCLF